MHILLQVNLGTVDGNPASGPGVIEIMESFEKYIPQNHDPFLVSGDGMSVERWLMPFWGRRNGRLQSHWLDWVIPCPQEFHLDITLLQVRGLLNVIGFNVLWVHNNCMR